MKTEEERNKTTREAYIAGRDAIIERLGENPRNEDVLDVIMLMAHQVLTQFQTAELERAAHNAAVFCDRLTLLVESTQLTTLPPNKGDHSHGAH